MVVAFVSMESMTGFLTWMGRGGQASVPESASRPRRVSLMFGSMEPSARMERGNWGREALPAFAGMTAAILAVGGSTVATLPALAEDAAVTLQVKVLSEGKSGGPTPAVGDLVGIRFRGSYNGTVFDDIFPGPEPFFVRVGSGNVIEGIEKVLPTLHLGERVHMVIPGELAFGKQGRKPAPGRPAIPPNATVEYDLELAEFPGHEAELLDLSDDF
mmetsp:Transcript_4305/g.8490  ORF Transcript_4305/g.8490 Transcript_4305/m.8490 type:complete len:215 (+) Transcript_4305:641-1285(+)